MPDAAPDRKPRARDLGIRIGRLDPGPLNAITDVAGVRVGHTTLIAGEGPLVRGQGPVRTGVTVILPHDGRIGTDPLFAGYHVLNGNGEMTGLAWVGESGLLTTPVAITNTHSVGVVRDALIAYQLRSLRRRLRHRLEPARGRRDLGRRPERHQRHARQAGASVRGDGRCLNRAGRRGLRRRRYRDDLPRL